MRRAIRHTLIAFASAGALAGCADVDPAAPAAESSPPAEASLETTPTAAATEITAAIPASTPYAFVAAEPRGVDALPWQPAELLPLFDRAMSRLADAEPLPPGEQTTRDRVRQLAWALGLQLDGRLEFEAMAELGIDLEGPWAVYGVGVFPAVRLSLADADAAQRTLTRVLETSTLDVERVTLGDDAQVELVRVGATWSLAVSVDRDRGHLVAGVVHDAMRDDALRALFEPPERALDLAALESNPGAGFVALDALANAFADPVRDGTGTLLAQSLGALGAPVLDATCGAEWSALAAQAPRIEVAATPVSFLDIESAELKLAVTDTALLTALASARADAGSLVVPEAATPAFSLGVNVDAATLLDVVSARAASAMDAPFECASLEPMNTALTRLAAARLWAPESVTTLRGGHLVVESMSAPETVGERWQPRGFARLAAGDPAAVWTLLSRVVDTEQAPALDALPKRGVATAVPLQGRLAERVPQAMLTRTDERTLEATFGETSSQPWAVSDDTAPMLKVGFDTGQMLRRWVDSRSEDAEADAQWLGRLSARAGIAESFGLRTLSVDVAPDGVVLSYRRNDTP